MLRGDCSNPAEAGNVAKKPEQVRLPTPVRPHQHGERPQLHRRLRDGPVVRDLQARNQGDASPSTLSNSPKPCKSRPHAPIMSRNGPGPSSAVPPSTRSVAPVTYVAAGDTR